MANKQTEDFEKDIVSFDQAIELATIGFDKQTLCGYDIADRQLYLCQVDEDGIYMPQKDLAAPTKSQVFRWFREKYELYYRITGVKQSKYHYSIDYQYKDGKWGMMGGEFLATYEEAENACISKLLELAKQQDNE
jgi:hypothetical protein